jgi:hypothetical protein
VTLPADEDSLRRTKLWLVPIAVLLHAAEEALVAPMLLRQMSEIGAPMTGRIAELPSAGAVIGLLVLLVVTAFGLIVLARAWPAARYALVVLQGVMAYNVLSHVAGAWMVGGYSAGLVTSVLIEAPLSVVIFRRLLAEPWMTRLRWAALVPLVPLIHGPGMRTALWAVTLI